MKICIPFTENLNYFFNSLCRECGIEFIMPPPVSRYTREIGEAYGEKNMCSAVKNKIGSVAECFYLGADTAIIFSSCRGCLNEDAERIAAALRKNGIRMRIISFVPKKSGIDEFSALIGREFGIPIFKLITLKKDMADCFKAMDEYRNLCIKIYSGIGKNRDFSTFMRIGESEMKKAGSVSALKVIYKALIKKSQRFLVHNFAPEIGILSRPGALPLYTDSKMRTNLALLGINSRDISGVWAYFKKRKGKNNIIDSPTDLINSVRTSAEMHYSDTAGIMCFVPESCLYYKLLKGIEPEIERKIGVPTLVAEWQRNGNEGENAQELWNFYLRVNEERKNKRGAILFGH